MVQWEYLVLLVNLETLDPLGYPGHKDLKALMVTVV